MTVKQFFKSNAFKCIAVLLCVLLISGVFLTLMYGLLEVTDRERLERAIKKIYTEATVDEITEVKVAQKGYGSSEIEAAYRLEVGEDVHYLVKSKGTGGYASGSITVWVAVKVTEEVQPEAVTPETTERPCIVYGKGITVVTKDGQTVKPTNIESIYKLAIDSNVGQTLISDINSSSLLSDIVAGYEDGVYYTTDEYVVSGASMSSGAICNAVNGALQFTGVEILGHSVTDKFNDLGCEYLDYIETLISDYEIVETDKVKYTITTKSNGYAGAFKLTITVGSDGTVSAYVIDKDGGTSSGSTDYKTMTNAASNYVGKGLDYFLSAMNGNAINTDVINTGASLSNFLCVYAGAFATANYQRCFNAAQGGNS